MVIFSLTFHILMMSLSFYIKKAERSSYGAVPNYCSGETDMNRFGSHQNHENLILYEGLPHQGLSEARRAGSFFWILSHRTATGAPHRGWRHSSYQMDKVVTIPAEYLNTTIFIETVQKTWTLILIFALSVWGKFIWCTIHGFCNDRVKVLDDENVFI